MDFYKDSNGDEIYIGHHVDVQVPEAGTDDFHYEYMGTVIDYNGYYVVVEDTDGDCFDIKPNDLRII